MKPIQKAREELEEARKAIGQMKSANDLKTYEKGWELFLLRLERVWNKLCSHLSSSPKYNNCPIIDQAKQLRKNDPLLSYLIVARGVNEHSIEEVTERQPGGIGINPAMGNILHIDHMTINNGHIFIKSKEPIKVDVIPAKIKLNQLAIGVAHSILQQYT